MKRRDFLKNAGVGAAAVGAGALAAPALASGNRVLNMVTTWPRNFPGLGTGAQRVADRITAMSGGKLTVKLHAAGELVPPFECFNAVSTGSADMYHGADYYWVGKHKGYAFFTAVPMGFTAAELEAWVHFGGGQQLWDELGAQFGVKGLLAGNTGPQMGGWFRDPITSVEDLKGLKMRMPGLGGTVLNELGATAVSLPGGEIFPSLQSGAIDATEWVGPYNDRAFGFHTILKNYVYPGYHEPGSGLAVGFNLNMWNSLDDSERALMTAACGAENDMMMAEYNARNGDALNDLLTNHGVNLVEMPAEAFKAIGEVSEQVVSDVQNVDALGKKLYDSYAAFRKNVDGWTRLADEAYTIARRQAVSM